jgi:hypothetical protein
MQMTSQMLLVTFFKLVPEYTTFKAALRHVVTRFDRFRLFCCPTLRGIEIKKLNWKYTRSRPRSTSLLVAVSFRFLSGLV